MRRWGRTATYIAVAVPLIYCLTRWAWALGIPLGVSPEFLRASPQATVGYRSSSAVTANTATAVAYDLRVFFAVVARGGAGQRSVSIRRFGPRLLPRLDESKTAKNRIHFDWMPTER